MKNLYLLLIAFAIFQASCKDFWHPDGAALNPEADYATVILNSRHSTSSAACYGALLISVTTGNNYRFEDGIDEGWGVYRLIVPAGTYYVTATGFSGFGGRNLRSDNFTVSKRGTKTISYYVSGGIFDDVPIEELR